MRTAFALAAFAALVLAAAPASAAERRYSVTSFDRVRLEGPFAVTLTTNVAPFAVASGSPRAIDGLSVRVEGRTLIIQRNREAAGRDSSPAGPVTLAIGTHGLASASVGGAGSLAIDRVRGLEFQAAIGGAGRLTLAAAELDRLKLAVAGSGSVIMAGRTRDASAIVRGSALVDLSGLDSRDLVLAASGPTAVQARASGTAKVTAIGTGSVTILGSPACTVKAEGSATVTGCER